MSLIINKIKNNKFLFVIIMAYIILFCFMPQKAMQSVSNSLYYVKEMLMIMPIILILTSLIEAWVPKKVIERNLGESSGAKGFLFSFLLGSFSAGPIYAAFPICKMLLRKGASVGNVVVILSAWAVIKVPMLINESKFLGVKFMIVRWILTVIAILFMSILTSKFVKREDLLIKDEVENEGDILTIDKKVCMGCGLCNRIEPNIFLIENKKAVVKKLLLRNESDDKIIKAIDTCPVKAINFISKITIMN